MINALIEAYEEDKREMDVLQSLIIQVERSKFDLPEQYTTRPEQTVSVLPDHYDENYCGLLLRDPDWAFFFWEIKESIYQEMERTAGFKGFFLHILENQTPEINGPMHHSYDLPVQTKMGSRYIQLPINDRFYQVEVVAQLTGELRVLSRSQILYTPENQVRRLAEINKGDSRRKVIMELSDFFECEPIKDREQVSETEGKTLPHRVGDWSDD